MPLFILVRQGPLPSWTEKAPVFMRPCLSTTGSLYGKSDTLNINLSHHLSVGFPFPWKPRTKNVLEGEKSKSRWLHMDKFQLAFLENQLKDVKTLYMRFLALCFVKTFGKPTERCKKESHAKFVALVESLGKPSERFQNYIRNYIKILSVCRRDVASASKMKAIHVSISFSVHKDPTTKKLQVGSVVLKVCAQVLFKKMLFW